MICLEKYIIHIIQQPNTLNATFTDSPALVQTLNWVIHYSSVMNNLNFKFKSCNLNSILIQLWVSISLQKHFYTTFHNTNQIHYIYHTTGMQLFGCKYAEKSCSGNILRENINNSWQSQTTRLASSTDLSNSHEGNTKLDWGGSVS